MTRQRRHAVATTSNTPLEFALDEASGPLLARARFRANELIAAFPARHSDANKRLVYELCSSSSCDDVGELTVARYRAMSPEALPLHSITPTRLISRLGAFDYVPIEPSQPAVVEWHLNFAHSNLFAFYRGALFAQDEMQVAEHPSLASLCEALNALAIPGLAPFTRDGNLPTPILIQGAHRRCAVATDANAALDRPNGLYGNRFAVASQAAIRRATTVFNSPVPSNIIAIEAPPGGTGEYTLSQLAYVLLTAHSGFRAAVLESQQSAGVKARTVIHTGHWGTGAYGGDRVVMALLQLLAATLSGIETLVFHSLESSGVLALQKAQTLYQQVCPQLPLDLADALDRIAAMKFNWGMGDGN